jgi:hypothetical protein
MRKQLLNYDLKCKSFFINHTNKLQEKNCVFIGLIYTYKKTALAKIYDRILQFGPHTLLFAWTGSSPADHGRILPRNYVLHYSEISFGRCRITDVFHYNVLLFIDYLCWIPDILLVNWLQRHAKPIKNLTNPWFMVVSS